MTQLRKEYNNLLSLYFLIFFNDTGFFCTLDLMIIWHKGLRVYFLEDVLGARSNSLLPVFLFLKARKCGFFGLFVYFHLFSQIRKWPRAESSQQPLYVQQSAVTYTGLCQYFFQFFSFPENLCKALWNVRTSHCYFRSMEKMHLLLKVCCL